MAELRVTSTGTIKLFESDDTSSVTIASPASLGGDRTITLPDANVDLTEVNTMPIANLDIDGGTDIGANIADSDLLIIDDGAGGTNRKTAASRIKTYAGFSVSDITGATALDATPADTDEFIISDAGTLKRVDYSYIKGSSTIGGLTDVTMDATNFADGLLIQPNSDGSAPTTGTLSTATENIGIGMNTFSALTSGDYNQVYGNRAGGGLTTGSENHLFGKSAGSGITTGQYNHIFGMNAGSTFDTESHNVAFGLSALGSSIAGAEYNTAIGNFSTDAITSGDGNTCVGHQSGSAITEGDENIFIGKTAGDSCTTGSNNILLGAGINPSSNSNDHCLGLGNNFGVAANDFSFGKASNVVTNDFDADANWSRSSDVRKKREIYDQELGLDFINDLRTVRFQWKPSNEIPKEWNDYSEKNNMDTDVIMHGFIAQEVKEALDKHANEKDKNFSGWKEGEDGMQHTSREMFVIPLIKAVQELSTEVKELKAKLEDK